MSQVAFYVVILVGLLLVGLYAMIRPETGRMWGSIKSTGDNKGRLGDQKQRSKDINRLIGLLVFLISLLALLAIAK